MMPWRRSLIPLILSVCALLITGGVACKDKATIPPNILLVTFDTTRWDHVDLNAADGTHTPTLAALAAGGAHFSRAYTPIPITLPAHTTLMTGTEPPWHGVRNNTHYRAVPSLNTLAEVLKAHGWSTGAAIAAAPLTSVFGLDQGFDIYDQQGLFDSTGEGSRLAALAPERDAEAVTTAALKIASGLKEPYFLWVHYFDPHEPLRAPSAYSENAPSAYDAEIAYADAQLGRLMGALPESDRGLLTVVTADHGESLGEHGEPTHAYFLHDATTRIPLIFHGFNGAAGGMEITSPARLADVMPTVLTQVDVPLPIDLHGRDLAPLWKGEAAEPRLVYGESIAPEETLGLAPIAALLKGDWRLVRTTKSRLFNLAHDPGETTDVAEANPEIVTDLSAALEHYITTHQKSTKATHTPTLDPQTAEHLKALGYVELGTSTGGDLYENLDLIMASHTLVFGVTGDIDVAALIGVLYDHPTARQLWEQGLNVLSETGEERYGEALNQGAQAQPDNILIQARLANHLASRGEPGASEALQRVLDSVTAESETLAHRDALTFAAQAAISIGRTEEAKAIIQKLDERTLTSANALFSRGLLKHRLQLLDGAIADYKAALAHSPGDADMWRNLGIALANASRLPEAEKALSQSLKADPAQPTIWLRMAQLAQAAGDSATVMDACRDHQRYGGSDPWCKAQLINLAPPDQSR